MQSIYQSPEEKPPGGMRFLLITWLAPFRLGIVVLISAPAGLYPSPVTGLPSEIKETYCRDLIKKRSKHS